MAPCPFPSVVGGLGLNGAGPVKSAGIAGEPDAERPVRAFDALGGVGGLGHRADRVDVLGDDVGLLVDGLEEVQIPALGCDRLAPHAVLPDVATGAAGVEREVLQVSRAVESEALGDDVDSGLAFEELPDVCGGHVGPERDVERVDVHERRGHLQPHRVDF